MVRQISTGGGKHHKKCKNTTQIQSRELVFKEDGQEYAIVTSLLGHRRCYVKTSDKIERIGVIRGNMRRSTSRVGNNDLVLISLREFQDSKADIIHVYKSDEVRSLIRYDEIEESFISNESFGEVNADHVCFEVIDDI
jgi:translation initiation factor 1A